MYAYLKKQYLKGDYIMTNKEKISWMLRVATEYGVKVDRGNMIRWDVESRNEQWRFNIKKNVIRVEYRSLEYCGNDVVWNRVRSTSIKKLNKDSWEESMRQVKNIQSGVETV
jgi:hypothetical protein